MKVQGFTSSLLFGAIAAVALVFAQHAFAPLVGSALVLALYLAAAAVAYASAIGQTPRESLRNGAVAVLGSAVVFAMARGTGELAIGLTIVLALARTGLDAGTRSRRRLCVEVVLGCAALAFASGLETPGWLGSSAALWGYALVQSLYFLVPASGLRFTPSPQASQGDAFDRARERLLIMLDEA